MIAVVLGKKIALLRPGVRGLPDGSPLTQLLTKDVKYESAADPRLLANLAPGRAIGRRNFPLTRRCRRTNARNTALLRLLKCTTARLQDSTFREQIRILP